MSGALPKHPKNVACQNDETTGSLWPPAVWSQKSSGPPDSSAKLENSPWLFVDFLDESFFLPPQNIILSGGTKFCKWWWFHPYVLKSFPTRKVGGSDDSSYPNLTTCKSAHMFFSKLSWLKLNHQEFADLLWVDPTRSWTWKQTDRGLAIALPEAGLARGWRPTDPLGRNDMFFFQMVFFNDARPLLSIAFVKLLEKLGGIWTWLPIKINTMFFFDIFYWHFI